MLKLWCKNFNGNGIRALYILYSTSSTTHINKGSNPCSSSSLANYLVSSLGFSENQSLSISAKLTKQKDSEKSQKLGNINLVDKAVAVVNLFKQHDFQDSHIRKIVCSVPKVLVSKVDKTLKPKIKVFLDLGFSGSDLILAVSENPLLLNQNLGPPIHALITVLGSAENVVTVLKRVGAYLSGATCNLVSNVELLQNCYGIPNDIILKHIMRMPNPFVLRTDLFREKLIRVEQKFGIPRGSKMFLYGLNLACFAEKTYEDKFEIFMSFGWTQSDVVTLTRANPMCLALSEARIRESLDFLMNQLDCKPYFLASRPAFFTCSVKKRLLPRHRFLQVLKEKGLIEGSCSLNTVVRVSETMFLKKYVEPFEEVHHIYARLMGYKVGSLTVRKLKAVPKVDIGF